MNRNPKFEWVSAFLASGIRPSSCITVGMAIADRWNGDTNQPYASVPYLVKTTGLSRATVERALKRLREEGWIAQARRGGRWGDQAVASRWRMTNPSVVIPNPSLSRSQPLTSEVLIDLPFRPAHVDPVGINGYVVDPDCPWCIPAEDICTAEGVTHKVHTVNGATDE